mgnify:FL=1
MYGASHTHAGLAALIEQNTRRLSDDELASIGMGEPPRDVQGSPFIRKRNLMNLRAALASVPREVLAEALAEMLTQRFDRVRASMIGRDVARIAEGGK